MRAEGEYSASARSPDCPHVLRSCPSGCATCRLVCLPVRNRGLHGGSGLAQPPYRVRKKQDVPGHHLRWCEMPSGDVPAPSPVPPWEVVHSFILPFWHKHMAWTVYMVHQGAGQRQMVNFFFCEGYIFFDSFLCFCFFRGDIWGQVYFLFSVSFSSLSSPWQLLAQVVYFLLWISFALDPDSGFQDIPHLPEASRPSRSSQGLLQLTASASHSLIGVVLLVSFFLIGWLAMWGGWLTLFFNPSYSPITLLQRLYNMKRIGQIFYWKNKIIFITR